MIVETKVHACRKCESQHIVKNGKNVCGSQQYLCRDCGASGVLNPKVAYTEEVKDLIIDAYQERSSMRGIERTFGVSRQTLSHWLKKEPVSCRPYQTHCSRHPRPLPSLNWMSCGPLFSANLTRFGSGLPCVVRLAKWSLLRWVIEVKRLAFVCGVQCLKFTKKQLATVIFGRPINASFPMINTDP